MTRRVALIDSCGGLADIDAGAAHASVVDAAAFVSGDGGVECRQTVADPTGHGSRIAELLLRGRELELLLGQVFTTAGPTSGAAVAAAIDWALERRAGLIHLSLGLAGDRAVLRTAVLRALDAGVILVAAMPARGAPAYPAAYPGVIRATGDARCAPDELSALRPWLFGGCARLGSVELLTVKSAAAGRAGGGASIGAAWVTRAILEQPALAPAAAVVALTARAKYLGPERRTGSVQNL